MKLKSWGFSKIKFLMFKRKVEQSLLSMQYVCVAFLALGSYISSIPATAAEQVYRPSLCLSKYQPSANLPRLGKVNLQWASLRVAFRTLVTFVKWSAFVSIFLEVPLILTQDVFLFFIFLAKPSPSFSLLLPLLFSLSLPSCSFLLVLLVPFHCLADTSCPVPLRRFTLWTGRFPETEP